MPRTRSLAWSELKIGILTVTALFLAGTMIFLLSGEGGFFWQRYSLKTVFDDIAGLKAGAPVRLSGMEVGSVSSVQFVGTQVEVTMQIAQEHQPRITTESRSSLGSVSLLGEAAVDITAAAGGMPIPEWGYVPAGRVTPSMADVAAGAAEGIAEATLLLQDIRSGRGTLGRLFTDETVYRDISTLVQSAERVASGINTGRGTLGQLATNPRMYEELSASVSDLNAITARIRSGEGSLGRLLQDPALADSVTGATQNLERVTGRLDRGEGTAGKLLTETELYDRMNSMVQRLDTLTTRLNEGEGTAGQLLRDPRLYENMTQTVDEIRGLIGEIRKDPRRYLNLRVSIF
jgi:phospholipid/cholesterol/gamma-HCH transport system substrate-binding protein